MATIGNRIRCRREQLGLSQDELAKKLGYKSRSSINKIELDQRNLTQSKIKAIADALDTTPAYIMGWEDGEAESLDAVQAIPSDDELMAAFFHGADPSLTEEDLEDMWQDAKNFRDFIIAKKMQEKK